MAKEEKQIRPPIISVLGHVDHGKTSLLDYIRHANVAAGESGGITQHIGAYQAEHQGRKLTLIDTPGHQAFSAMRARGGQAADLAILVVAADDGVMPQTKESIAHIKNAGIPFVVAINKIDLPSSNPEQIKGQLAQEEVLVEGFGGNVPVALVSAKTGQGVAELLDVLLLLADLEELTADPQGPLEALVIESSLDKHRGPVATVLVKNGTLKVGDQLVESKGGKPSKIKALVDWTGKRLDSAGPSTPVQVLGFTSVPPVGASFTHEGLSLAAKVDVTPEKIAGLAVPILVKTDVAGTLEAIISSLPPQLQLVGQGTGPINESDILHAQTTKALVIGFRVTPTPAAKRMAQIENVPIHTFTTIYDLLEEVEEMVKQQIESAKEPEPAGKARVIQLFEHQGTKIIGAKVTSGIIKVGNDIIVVRKGEEFGRTQIKSLRIGRDNQTKVTLGQEFGAVISPELDIKPEDELISPHKNG